MSKNKDLGRERYLRRYFRIFHAQRARKPKVAARPVARERGIFSKQLLRDMFLTPRQFTGGFEFQLAKRSKEFRYRRSRSKYAHLATGKGIAHTEDMRVARAADRRSAL